MCFATPFALCKSENCILQLAPAQHTLFLLLRLPQMFDGLTIQACFQKILHVVIFSFLRLQPNAEHSPHQYIYPNIYPNRLIGDSHKQQ